MRPLEHGGGDEADEPGGGWPLGWAASIGLLVGILLGLITGGG